MKKLSTITLILMQMFLLENLYGQENSYEHKEGPIKTEISYVTKNRDTLYIREDYFSIFESVWSLEENKNDKPVLIMVDDVKKVYAKLED